MPLFWHGHPWAGSSVAPCVRYGSRSPAPPHGFAATASINDRHWVGRERFKAIKVLVAYAEQLAQAHAHFIDTNEGVRLQAVQQTYRWTHLF